MSLQTVRALPEVLKFIVDNRGRTCPVADSGLPLIATNCLKEGKREPVFENVRYVDDETYSHWFRAHPMPRDVLFVCKGSPGRVAVVPDPVSFCIAQDMVALRADPLVMDPGYLYYRLCAPDVRAKISNLHVGTMIPHFKKGDFGKLRFAVHDCLDEQRAIAEVLEAIDAKIAANDRAAAISTSLIGSMYAEALEVEAETFPLLDVFDVDFGEAFKGGSFSQPGIGRPLIRIRDLKTFRSQVWTTEIRGRETLVQPGDVVVGMDAEFRATWWLGTEGLLNQRVCRVSSLNGGAALVGEALRWPLATIENEKTGTTVIHLNKADLARTRVQIPVGKALEKFESAAQPVLHARVALAAQNRALSTTRDELLPLLMSGKVLVKDTKKIAEGVI